MPYGDGTGPLGLGCGIGRYGCGRMRVCRDIRAGMMFGDAFLEGEDLKKSFLESEIKRLDDYKKFLERALENIQKQNK
jgi:hypothetical protein